MERLPTRNSSFPKSSTVVVGVDVGGPRKGFHAVALHDGRYHDKRATKSAHEIKEWCLGLGAKVIGIDAPCRWSTSGRGRLAEHKLVEKGIRCFYTPSEKVAKINNFYGWMCVGAELYRFMEQGQDYPLFDGETVPKDGGVCFETFPHATACALAGKRVSGKDKREIRLELLNQAGMDTKELKGIDTIDAALCALMAHRLITGSYKAYGEAQTGFIIVPD